MKTVFNAKGKVDITQTSNKTDQNEMDFTAQELINQHKRRETRRQVFHFIEVVAFPLFSVFVVIGVVVFVWHILAPADLRWLTDAEVNELRNFGLSVCTGVFSALVSSMVLGSKN